MATWKKLIVSGANISELNNDSGFILSNADGVNLTGSFSGSFTGDGSNLTGLTADSIAFTNITGKPTLVSASAQISYPDVSNIPNGIISGAAQVAANLPADTVSGSAQISYTGITNVPGGIVSSSTQVVNHLPGGTISGSAQVVDALPAGTISSSAQIDNLFNQDGVVSSSAQIEALGFISASVAVVSSSAQIDFTQITNTGGIVSSSAQVVSALPAGTVSSSAQVSAFLPTDVVSSSAQISYTGITNVPAGIVSASAIGSTANQGEVVLITNGASGSAQSIGLGTTDGVQFSSLTLTGNGVVQGDLTVQGNFTNLNTTNLNIEDKYILLNSGSSSGDSGIVFGGADGVVNSGTALVFDTSYNGNDGRFAVVNTLASNASTDQTPNYYLAGAFIGNETDAATAQTDHQGNIRIDGEDIYIYS